MYFRLNVCLHAHDSLQAVNTKFLFLILRVLVVLKVASFVGKPVF